MNPPSTPPQPPTYEGRRLPHPGEELVDQGLQFDLGTLLSRRRMMKAMGLGAVGVGLAACGAGSTLSPVSSSAATTAASSGASDALTEIPEETGGPYPGDGTNGPDILEQSGVVRADIRSSFGTSTTTAEGIPATLQLTIVNLEGGKNPYAGAAVYVWHCNRSGKYSLYSSGLENENYLRGVQVADSSGVVEFTTIFPACYSGRWPHMHFEVYPDEASITDHSKCIATSQLALPKDICDVVYATTGYEQSITNLSQASLSTDNVFGNDSAVHQLPTVTGDPNQGYLLALTVGVDASTTQAAAAAPSGGGGMGTPPSGGMGAPPSGGMGTPPSGGMGAPPSGGMGAPPSGNATPTTSS